uniref:Uncharacterized protein n=1 Tax=Romanomermis culicivorax TaxID=13658 RepID=A0A915HMZ6_ROMCU
MNEKGVADELRFIRHTIFKIATAIKTDKCSPLVPELVNINYLRNSCRRRLVKVESASDTESQNEPISSISMEFKRQKLKNGTRKNDQSSKRKSVGRSKRYRSASPGDSVGPTIMKHFKIPLQRCDDLLENGRSSQDVKLIDLVNPANGSRKRPADDLNSSSEYGKNDNIDDTSDSRRRSLRRLSPSLSRFSSPSSSIKVSIRRTNRVSEKMEQILPPNLIVDL